MLLRFACRMTILRAIGSTLRDDFQHPGLVVAPIVNDRMRALFVVQYLRARDQFRLLLCGSGGGGSRLVVALSRIVFGFVEIVPIVILCMWTLRSILVRVLQALTLVEMVAML